jgi:hypothetical protein
VVIKGIGMLAHARGRKDFKRLGRITPHLPGPRRREMKFDGAQCGSVIGNIEGYFLPDLNSTAFPLALNTVWDS